MHVSVGDPLISGGRQGGVQGNTSEHQDHGQGHDCRVQKTKEENTMDDISEVVQPQNRRHQHKTNSANNRGHSSRGGQANDRHYAREPRGHSTPVEECLSTMGSRLTRDYSDRIPRDNLPEDDVNCGRNEELSRTQSTTAQLDQIQTVDNKLRNQLSMEDNNGCSIGMQSERAQDSQMQPGQYYSLPRSRKTTSTFGPTLRNNQAVEYGQDTTVKLHSSHPMTSTHEPVSGYTNGDINSTNIQTNGGHGMQSTPCSLVNLNSSSHTFEPIHPDHKSPGTRSTSIHSPCTSEQTQHLHEPTIHAATNFSPRKPVATRSPPSSASRERDFHSINQPGVSTPRLQPGNYNTLPRSFPHRQTSTETICRSGDVASHPSSAPAPAPRTKRVLPATPPSATTPTNGSATTPPSRARCHSARIQHLAEFTTRLSKQYNHDNQ